MMGKGKKGGKRMSKKQLSERLQDFFASQPSKTLSFKEIFRALKLDTHPLKMLAIDIMEEMTWDDFLTRVTEKFIQTQHERSGARRHIHSQVKWKELVLTR